MRLVVVGVAPTGTTGRCIGFDSFWDTTVLLTAAEVKSAIAGPNVYIALHIRRADAGQRPFTFTLEEMVTKVAQGGWSEGLRTTMVKRIRKADIARLQVMQAAAGVEGHLSACRESMGSRSAYAHVNMNEVVAARQRAIATHLKEAKGDRSALDIMYPARKLSANLKTIDSVFRGPAHAVPAAGDLAGVDVVFTMKAAHDRTTDIHTLQQVYMGAKKPGDEREYVETFTGGASGLGPAYVYHEDEKCARFLVHNGVICCLRNPLLQLKMDDEIRRENDLNASLDVVAYRNSSAVEEIEAVVACIVGVEVSTWTCDVLRRAHCDRHQLQQLHRDWDKTEQPGWSNVWVGLYYPAGGSYVNSNGELVCMMPGQMLLFAGRSFVHAAGLVLRLSMRDRMHPAPSLNERRHFHMSSYADVVSPKHR